MTAAFRYLVPGLLCLFLGSAPLQAQEVDSSIENPADPAVQIGPWPAHIVEGGPVLTKLYHLRR